MKRTQLFDRNLISIYNILKTKCCTFSNSVKTELKIVYIIFINFRQRKRNTNGNPTEGKKEPIIII